MNVAGALGTAAGFAVGIIAHEVVTHRTAVALGDKTPRLHKRTGPDPRAHADPLGSYVFPGIFVFATLFSGFVLPPFGWGKRHAFTRRNLRNIKRDTVLVALSGPLVTGLLAAGSAAAVAGVPSMTAANFLAWFALVNIGLTIFELLPIPGRDGGRALSVFLSPRAAQKMEDLEEYEVLFIIGLYTLLLRLTTDIFFAGCRALTPAGALTC